MACRSHLFFHWCRYRSATGIESQLSFPSLLHGGSGFTRNYTFGIFFNHYVLDLSGKVGSNIASEIGTMRITEQIDALEVMGVNSANYLILPKIMAFIVFIPVLVVFSILSVSWEVTLCAL